MPKIQGKFRSKFMVWQSERMKHLNKSGGTGNSNTINATKQN